MSGPGSSDPRADPERDAWLREALRHAPDAQAEPPRALSDAIRREAHAAASQRRRPDVRPDSAFAAFWAWLARPQAAAGFASVMVATLVGLLWWDRPMPAPTEPVPAAPMSQPNASPAAIAAPVPKDEARGEAKPATLTTPPAEISSVRRELQRTAPAATRGGPPSPAPLQMRREDGAAERVMADAQGKSAPAPSPSPSPSPSLQIAEAARPAAAPEAPAAPVATAAPAAPVAAAALEAAAIRDQSARNVGQLARMAESRQAKAEPTAPGAAGLAAWRASIAAEPQRWTWQRGSGVVQPADAALTAMLARLDAATAGRWRSVPDVVAPGGLTLYRDGVAVARWSLRSDPPGVMQISNGSVLGADLDAADAAALSGMPGTPAR